MVFGYLFCIVAAAVAGGMTYALGLFSAPLWLAIIVGGAVLPLYILLGVVYAGGFYHSWKSIFGKQEEKSDDN